MDTNEKMVEEQTNPEPGQGEQFVAMEDLPPVPLNNTEPDATPFMEWIPKAVKEMEIFKDVEDTEGFIQRIEKINEDLNNPQRFVPEDYAIEVPEGFELREDIANDFKAVAKEAGLSQDQASTLVTFWNKLNLKLSEEQASKANDVENYLKGKWGNSFDNNLSVAKKALKHYGNDDFVKFIDKSKLGNNPDFIEFVYNIGKALQEDSLVSGDLQAKQHNVERFHGMPIINWQM